MTMALLVASRPAGFAEIGMTPNRHGESRWVQRSAAGLPSRTLFSTGSAASQKTVHRSSWIPGFSSVAGGFATPSFQADVVLRLLLLLMAAVPTLVGPGAQMFPCLGSLIAPRSTPTTFTSYHSKQTHVVIGRHQDGIRMVRSTLQSILCTRRMPRQAGFPMTSYCALVQLHAETRNGHSRRTPKERLKRMTTTSGLENA
jgi:hypothetical protein